MNEQIVLVSFHNAGGFVYKFKSKRPITLAKVVKYFVETEDFNEDKDSITFVADLMEITI